MFSSRIYNMLARFHAHHKGAIIRVESIGRHSCNISMATDDEVSLPVTIRHSADKRFLYFSVETDRFSVLGDSQLRYYPDQNNAYLIHAYDRARGKAMMRVQANAYDYTQIEFILEHLSHTQTLVAKNVFA